MPAAVISFAAPPLLAAFAAELGPGMPLFGDPDRQLYAAFGFRRASVARVWLDPRAVANDIGLRLRGRRARPALPRQDTLQLGGDVVIDAAGRVAWVYASRGPEDRPSVAAIIEAMLRCR
ncbi:MAG: AhpC/TSA family protein [Solirubrobacteraceae bacterium]